MFNSLDWFKGTFAGSPCIFFKKTEKRHAFLMFPVDFPFNQFSDQYANICKSRNSHTPSGINRTLLNRQILINKLFNIISQINRRVSRFFFCGRQNCYADPGWLQWGRLKGCLRASAGVFHGFIPSEVEKKNICLQILIHD